MDGRKEFWCKLLLLGDFCLHFKTKWHFACCAAASDTVQPDKLPLTKIFPFYPDFIRFLTRKYMQFLPASQQKHFK